MRAESLYQFALRWSQVGITSRSERAREIISIASAGVLFVVIGFTLGWSPLFIVLGSASISVSTFLAGSLARVVACLFGAIGTLGAIVAAIVFIHQPLLATLHVTWGWVAVAWWVLVVAFAFALRRSGVDRDFGIAEIVGCWVGILMALSASRKIDTSTNLIRYLVHVEDNEAWVGLLTQIGTTDVVGAGFVEKFDGRGPIMPTILGLLEHFQGAAIPSYNAAFAAYAFAIFLVPLVAASLLRRCNTRGILTLVVFALVVIGWAYRVPFLLFASYGHLTATWAFVFLLSAVGIMAFDRQRPGFVPMLAGLLFAMGTVWYPIFPLGIAALLVVGWRSWRDYVGVTRIGALALVTAVVLVLLSQMLQAIGIGAPSDGSSNLTTLYAAQGGTASMDGSLQVLVILALVGLAFVPATLAPHALSSLWRSLLVGVSFVCLVFAGAFVAKLGLGYGPTKVWFIIGFATAVVLVSIAPRFRLHPRAVLAVALALIIGSLAYGGSGDVLARSWPGGGSDPGWLAPIVAVAATDNPQHPRPLGCFSNDKLNAYFCTRWGAGLTVAGNSAFLTYRLEVANGIDSTAEVDRLTKDGVLRESDLIVLDLPDEAHPWGWTLIQNAGRVYGMDGKLLDPRPVAPAGQ